MKSITNCLFLVALTCVCFTSSSAQSKPPYKTQMNYDRFKDISIIAVEDMPVVGSVFGYGIFLSAAFVCPGNALCKPETVALGFTVVNGDNKSVTVRAIRDGVRQPAFEMKRLGKLAVKPLGVTGEGYMVPMQSSGFIKMANSKAVEFQLFDNVEFTLTEEHLEGLRKLVEMMK